MTVGAQQLDVSKRVVRRVTILVIYPINSAINWGRWFPIRLSTT
jgi:hypothetical protein